MDNESKDNQAEQKCVANKTEEVSKKSDGTGRITDNQNGGEGSTQHIPNLGVSKKTVKGKPQDAEEQTENSKKTGEIDSKAEEEGGMTGKEMKAAVEDVPDGTLEPKTIAKPSTCFVPEDLRGGEDETLTSIAAESGTNNVVALDGQDIQDCSQDESTLREMQAVDESELLSIDDSSDSAESDWELSDESAAVQEEFDDPTRSSESDEFVAEENIPENPVLHGRINGGHGSIMYADDFNMGVIIGGSPHNRVIEINGMFFNMLATGVLDYAGQNGSSLSSDTSSLSGFAEFSDDSDSDSTAPI